MVQFVPRKRLSDAIADSLRKNPVTALIGPRRVGKSTLARLFAGEDRNRFDLENPIDLARLGSDSYGILSSLRGVVVIDEIQEIPEIVSQLRVIVDDPMCQSRFLVTGSASPQLTGQTSQTLAGRIRHLEMGGFDLNEIEPGSFRRLWFRGGLPQSFLAASDDDAKSWLEEFMKTWVMRDIPRLAGSRLSPQTLSRFLLMLAHYHGQAWNQREVADSLGIDVKSVQRYLEVFEGAYLVRRLMPMESNLGKRVRKAHRFYFRDSGLLHRLLRLRDIEELRTHNRVGASWEGFAIEQTIRVFGYDAEDCYFWRTHAGAEIDLICAEGNRLTAFEFKSSSSDPRVSKGTHEAMKDLNLDLLYVVYPGERDFMLRDGIRALPITKLAEAAADRRR
jgi:predicted AAA+ superfamily ATPase